MQIKESTVRARIEPDLKEEVENILNKIGISTAEAIRIFMNQIRLHNGIPYPLQVPNQSTEKALEETADYKSLSSYNSVADLSKDIDNE
ncbi:MAG: type II toxin-antitoxin system RelB/DinJ family antitoxin [Candidatus Anammoxibacter sp.]